MSLDRLPHRPQSAGDEGPPYPPAPDRLPTGLIRGGRYSVRFASREDELDQVLRLRFEIFNLELGEGLASSFATGRDEDPFDRQCHHLMVEDIPSRSIIGTYRMQTLEMAAAAGGFYSAGEYDLEPLGVEVKARAVEVGRACISRPHRNRQVLFLLWKGLAQYLAHNQKRFLFGCCSIPGLDPTAAWRAAAHFEARGQHHATVSCRPRPEVACPPPLEPALPDPGLELPSLFRTYLRYGGQVVSPPALDHTFNTTDFLVLFDVEAMDPRSYRLFFESPAPAPD